MQQPMGRADTAMGDVIRIVLVDDHAMVRKGLQSVLEITGEVHVVGEARDAEEALSVLEKTPCDVVVADLSLPGKDGIWLTHEVKARFPGLPVLVLTMHIEDHMVVDALRAGANGYVLKSSTYQELLEAIGQVHATGFFLHPNLARPLVQELKSTRPVNLGKITHREIEILQKAAYGLSNKEIGEQLCLSESTVKSHLRNLYRKIEVQDRTQAILYGLRSGMIRQAPTLPPTGQPPADGDGSG